jgi:hypothetical protein
MKKATALICACIAVLAAGCYVAGLKATYRSEDEEAAVEVERGRLHCPAETPLR